MDWWFGLVGLSIPWAVVYLLVSIKLTALSITIYLHRYSSHRSLDLHPAVQHVFRAWLWFGTGMETKAWTAIHRKHHALTETDQDPHSPKIHGLKEILLRGTEHYRVADTPETREKYGKGTPDDWLERNLYAKYTTLGVTLHAVTLLVLFGSVGIVVWALQMAWTPLMGAGVINGIGHAWGYRNFEVNDTSKNIVPWGVLIAGEELHNNHHTYPNSPKFSVRPWEFDIGWIWIRMLEFSGLAHPHRVGPIATKVEGKEIIDLDTIRALLNDRFRIMSRYANEVIAPVARQEHKRADATTRELLRRCKSVLCRDEILIDDVQNQRRAAIVKQNPRLAFIYQKRVELAALWSQRTKCGEELLEAFRQWCSEAESSGVTVLQDFVKELRRYSLPQMAKVTS